MTFDMRQQLLLEQAVKTVSAMEQSVSIDGEFGGRLCILQVVAPCTDKTVRQLQNAMALAKDAESNTNDCDQLATALYMHVALLFPDSEVDISFDDENRTYTFHFNPLLTKENQNG